MRIIQCTISGVDGGGYAWQNVFHCSTDNDDAAEKDLLNEAVAVIWDAIEDPFKSSMADETKILNFSARIIKPATSYTMNRPLTLLGVRDVSQYPGPVAGKLALYPETGAHVGHMYLPGTCVQDYNEDVIQPTYNGLLTDIGTALLTIDGTLGGFHWQLVIFNKKTSAAINVVAFAALLTACYLSKRARG